MLIGAELALFILGVYALVTGRLLTDRKSKHPIVGKPARLIGLIGVLPIPLSMLVASVVAAVFVARGIEVAPGRFFWVGTAIEGSIIILCIAAMTVLMRIHRARAERQGDGRLT